MGQIYGEEGLLRSGIFKDGHLLHQTHVKSQASGFLSISGKYTQKIALWHGFLQRQNEYNWSFGEHNENDNLNGSGIQISPNGTIQLGYWINGKRATGNFIEIENNRGLNVGVMYSSGNGVLKRKFTRYKIDGTA